VDREQLSDLLEAGPPVADAPHQHPAQHAPKLGGQIARALGLERLDLLHDPAVYQEVRAAQGAVEPGGFEDNCVEIGAEPQWSPEEPPVGLKVVGS
jgi:hypothetical protein